MEYYGSQINKLIEELSRLPGIGAKSAQRLAFHIIGMPREQVESLSSAIVNAKTNVRYCSCCYTLTDEELCPICRNPNRNHRVIMVVENTRDMAAYEKTQKYDGVYHVLHGAISPMLGIGPNDIKLKELMKRLEDDVDEVIIATNSSLEGETTAMYISKLVKPTGINVSRIASGVPVGGDLENIDEERKRDKECRTKNRGRNIESNVRFKKARNQYYLSIAAIIMLGIGGVYGVNNFMDKGFFKGYLLAIGVFMIFFVLKLSISRQKMKDNMSQNKWKDTDEKDIEDDIYEDGRYKDDRYEREYDRINAVLDKLGYNGYSIRELKGELREINRRLETGTSSAQDKISARIEKYEDMLKAAGSRKVKLNNEYKRLADEREEVLKRTRKLKDAASMPLNGRMVELMNAMCGKEYDSIIIGEKGCLKVRESGETNYHECKYLSNATSMQAYLALRLSLCEAIGNGEVKLPILLDDILDVCDDERIDRTVEVLKDLDTQVIMFTCHRWITKK